jgi:hypothetical protein
MTDSIVFIFNSDVTVSILILSLLVISFILLRNLISVQLYIYV